VDRALFFCMYFMTFQVSKGPAREGAVWFAPLNFNGLEENVFFLV